MSSVARGSIASARPVRGVRFESIDILRGLVMIIMALDHTRDYFSGAAFDPTDLTKTDAFWFFTRWMTHFCAPVFVFLTGTSAFLAYSKGTLSRSPFSLFLMSRGLWLVFLEVAVISPLGWSFRLDGAFTRLQVIWVIGLSMIVLAALARLVTPGTIGWIGVSMIVFHNVLDGARSAWLGPLAGTWRLLHQFAMFQPLPGKVIVSIYPLIPWVGVMALGFGCGKVFLDSPTRQRKMFQWCGFAMIVIFLVLRLTNFYGDPMPWGQQKTGLLTFLSVLNTTKYPPSLLYLCMTLGPAALFLAWCERMPKKLSGPLATFGCVPLFYYLLHLPLIHGLAVLLSEIRYGSAVWLFQDPLIANRSAHPLPHDYGYSLGVIWLIWICIVLLLFPLCQWYAGVKRASGNRFLRYL